MKKTLRTRIAILLLALFAVGTAHAQSMRDPSQDPLLREAWDTIYRMDCIKYEPAMGTTYFFNTCNIPVQVSYCSSYGPTYCRPGRTGAVTVPAASRTPVQVFGTTTWTACQAPARVCDICRADTNPCDPVTGVPVYENQNPTPD